jgi:hypothetical protein
MIQKNQIYESVLEKILQESNDKWWNYLNSLLAKDKKSIIKNGQSLIQVKKTWGAGTKSALAILYSANQITEYRTSLNKTCLLETKKITKIVIEDLKKIKNKLTTLGGDHSVDTDMIKLFKELDTRLNSSLTLYKKFNDWKSLLTLIGTYCAIFSLKELLHGQTDIVTKSFSKNDPMLIAKELSIETKETSKEQVKNQIYQEITQRITSLFDRFLGESYDQLTGKTIQNNFQTPLEWYQKMCQTFCTEEFLNEFIFLIVKKSGYKPRDV